MCRRTRKQRKTSPPVTGLISSHKEAAGGTLGLRDKKRPSELHNPSPGLRQCHKVSHDWLNKNTKSVEVPASHLGHWLRLLKGEDLNSFLSVWMFFKVQWNQWFRVTPRAECSRHFSGHYAEERSRLFTAWFWVYEEVQYGSFFSCKFPFR